MLRFTRPSIDDLTRLLAKAKAADLSYPEISATKDSPLPAGYRLDRYERHLSSDETVFERAVEALRGWEAHVGAGVEIVPGDARVTVGETVQAADGRLAIQLARDLRPDLVVMDITMPRMDGISAARAILQTHPSARIVFLSGTETAKKLSEASAYGVVIEKNVIDLRAELCAAAV